MELVGIDEVRGAARRLEGVIQATPVEASRALSKECDGDVRMKCENLQRAGSFKVRGAYNRIAQLDDAEKERGVVAASAGNHAQGVALGARLQGVRATVVMPTSAPLPKLEATEAYGAEVIIEGESVYESLQVAEAFAKEHDRVFVHPYDHRDVIAGQGTIGLELVRDVPDLATVVVPVGGGGLISGIAVALRALLPDVRIIGVQATGAASFPPALASGQPQALPRVETIADGIAVKRPGGLTLAHVHDLVDEIVTVDDDAIARAVVNLLERAKLLVEPAGAAGVAALREGLVEVDHRPVVAVLSGGNIDPLLVRGLMTSGLASEGRYLTLSTTIDDRPGALVALLTLLANQRANVVAVEHHRFDRQLRYGQVEVMLELEARGHEHIAEIHRALHEAGYPLTD